MQSNWHCGNDNDDKNKQKKKKSKKVWGHKLKELKDPKVEHVLYRAAPDTVSQVCAGFWPPYVWKQELSPTKCGVVKNERIWGLIVIFSFILKL